MPISIYIFQFILFKKVLKLIVQRDINGLNNTKDNKTKDTSKKIKNSTFDKQATALIIVENKKIKEDELI